jgi:hypothetical protein
MNAYFKLTHAGKKNQCDATDVWYCTSTARNTEYFVQGKAVCVLEVWCAGVTGEEIGEVLMCVSVCESLSFVFTCCLKGVETDVL